MDIRQWLEATNDPQDGPSLAEQLQLPSFLHRRPEAAEPTYKRRSQRKRSSSDSSFVEANDVRRDSPKRVRKHSKTDLQTESSSGSSSSESGKSDSSDKYRRKPRRKTRPDRYEPKKDKKRQHERRKSEKDGKEPKHHKRRTGRRTKDKPTVWMATAINAKNGSKERLTLKPLDQAPMKKKDAQSPPRRRGLPDLVFSEMRFLQKRKEGHEERASPDKPNVEATKKRKRKDRARANEDEISAYFTSKRPPLMERDSNAISRPAAAQRKTTVSSHDVIEKSSASVSRVKPSIELPDKPFLGFGSRGTCPSGSRLVWSASNHPASPPRPFENATTQVELELLKGNSTNGLKTGDSRTRTELTEKKSYKPGVVQNASADALNNGKIPAISSNRKGHMHVDTKVDFRKTLASSIVPSVDIPRPSDANEHQRQPHRDMDTQCAGHPTGKIAQDHATHHSRSPHRPSQQGLDKEGSGLAPRSSSPIAKLLRECRAAEDELLRLDREHMELEQRQQAALPEEVSQPPRRRDAFQIHTDDHAQAVFYEQSEHSELPYRAWNEHDIRQPHPDYTIDDDENLHANGYAYGNVYAYYDLDDSAPPVVGGHPTGHGVGVDLDEFDEALLEQEERRLRYDTPDETDAALAGFWRPHKLY